MPSAWQHQSPGTLCPWLTWSLCAVASLQPAGRAEGVVVFVALHVGHLPLLLTVLVWLAWAGAGVGGEEAVGALVALGVLKGGTCAWGHNGTVRSWHRSRGSTWG